MEKLKLDENSFYYLLELPKNQKWDQKAVNYLAHECGCEVQQFALTPYRLLITKPLDKELWSLQYKFKCAIASTDYWVRWDTDGFRVWFFEGMVGVCVEDAISRMLKLIKDKPGMIVCDFNGQNIEVTKDDTLESAYTGWNNRMEEAHEAYRKKQEAYQQTDEYKEIVRKRDLKRAQEIEKKNKWLSLVGPEPTYINKDEWDSLLAKQSGDGYGIACFTYAKLWARLMEGAMKDGHKLVDIADETSHLADEEGITGFMYGTAVYILAQTWIHGDSLRRWHNKETQIGDEGEAANESGATLNPALLTISA